MSQVPQPPAAGQRAAWSWILFDWAAQPYFTLVTTFVFAPYFASRIADSPTQGQALWGYATGAAGLAIAILSPLFGAVADATGRRKPWITAFSLLLIAGSLPLWWVVPGAPWAVWLALSAYVIGTLGVEFSTVFTNAMMPSLAPPQRLGRLSGQGWAAGYVGGLVSLFIVFALLAANPETGRTLLGLRPAFGLDPAAFEADRASGPFTALWYVLFVLPLFFFVPDGARAMPLRRGIRQGLANLAATMSAIRRHKDAFTFLLANMIYKDGLAALFAFGGIYGAGLFGWSAVQLGLFGIWLTIAGTIGAFVGGWLDDRYGSKPVIMGALVLLLIGGLGILSIGGSSVLFAITVVPHAPGTGLLASIPEQAFFAAGGLVGMAGGPLQSASRTLLVQLAPPAEITQYFGLLALSGKVTSFAAPLLVALVTAASNSQRLGVSVIFLFFLAAAAIMARVRPPAAHPA